MMLEFLETGKALYLLTTVCALGLLARLTARSLYKRLMRETDNMTLTKNRYLRDLKQKAENSYRLNQGIQNTQAFLEKQLSSCRFMGITLNGWGNLSAQLTILCFLAGGIGSFAAYWYRCDNYYVVLYGSVGILMGLLTLFVDCGVNLPEKRSQLLNSLRDYMENSLFRRLDKELAQTAAAERGQTVERGAVLERASALDRKAVLERGQSLEHSHTEYGQAGEQSQEQEFGKDREETLRASVRNGGRAGQKAAASQMTGVGETASERTARKGNRGIRKTAAQAAEEVPKAVESQSDVDYIRHSLEQIAASKEKMRPDRNWMKELSDEELTVVGEILRQYLV